MLKEVSLYEESGNACLHQSKQAGCWTQKLHMHSTGAHGVKQFLPLETPLDKEAFHFLNNWPWKHHMGYITHTHIRVSAFMRQIKIRTSLKQSSFHPIACQMEMYSYYFHHNWLQNISKMSKFRIRWSEQRHSLNFFVVFLRNPPLQTF